MEDQNNMSKGTSASTRGSKDSSASSASSGSSSSIVDQTMDKAKDLMSMNEDHEEGGFTKAIENQTAKIPSGVFLTVALGAMAVAAVLAVTSKRKGAANFIGQWVPSILLMGVYNKIVKTHGSDSKTPATLH